MAQSVLKIAMAFQEPLNSNSSVFLNTFSSRESDSSIHTTVEYEIINCLCLECDNVFYLGVIKFMLHQFHTLLQQGHAMRKH